MEGTEIYAEGGRIKEVKGCGMAAGTVIAVRNLFFNTPARLKFMKTPETESGHVGELLTRLAISRPEIRFSYLNDGKVVFRALDADLKERVATMLGRPIAASLYPVSYQAAGDLKVTGLVAAPDCSRSAASHLYTYINGRFIKDKLVQHAILQAYRNFLERGRYPVVAVFIEIPPGEVDVNVHPTKHEVRFREQGRVHDAIQTAVEGVLKETPWLKRGQPAAGSHSFPLKELVARPARIDVAVPTPAENTGVWPVASKAAEQAGRLAPLEREDAKELPRSNASDLSQARVAEVRELLTGYQARPQPPFRPYFQPPETSKNSPAAKVSAAATPAPVVGAAEAEANDIDERGYFASLAVIGQFNASYIVCQRGVDLVLIDQHAAHERVAFERLKREFAAREVDSQGLLFPDTMELSFRESAVLQEHVAEVARLGFLLEAFGGNTWILKSVPQILAGSEYLRTMRDILEELGSLSRSRTFTDLQEDMLARIACHSVVRGRRTLSQQEIAALFRQMDQTDFSSNCPHGRPVMQTITLAEVEKMFKRG